MRHTTAEAKRSYVDNFAGGDLNVVLLADCRVVIVQYFFA